MNRNSYGDADIDVFFFLNVAKIGLKMPPEAALIICPLFS